MTSTNDRAAKTIKRGCSNGAIRLDMADAEQDHLTARLPVVSLDAVSLVERHDLQHPVPLQNVTTWPDLRVSVTHLRGPVILVLAVGQDAAALGLRPARRCLGARPVRPRRPSPLGEEGCGG